MNIQRHEYLQNSQILRPSLDQISEKLVNLQHQLRPTLKCLLQLVATTLHFLQKGWFQTTIYQSREVLHPILLHIVEPKHTRIVTNNTKSIKFSSEVTLNKSMHGEHTPRIKLKRGRKIKRLQLKVTNIINEQSLLGFTNYQDKLNLQLLSRKCTTQKGKHQIIKLYIQYAKPSKQNTNCKFSYAT